MALDNEFVGKRIRNIRKIHNMTQRKFSEKMHMTQQTLSRYENGKNPIPNDVLDNISKEFHVPLSYFFGINTDDFSEDELLLIEYYRKVDDCLKESVYELVKTIAKDFCKKE